jgi:hypothetical protein
MLHESSSYPEPAHNEKVLAFLCLFTLNILNSRDKMRSKTVKTIDILQDSLDRKYRFPLVYI